jgi:hypothetical protein
MAELIGTVIIFLILLAVASMVLGMFWHESTVITEVFNVKITWRLAVAIGVAMWGTSQIA